MSELTIYDSSGSIRVPKEAGDLSAEQRERKRDLFFNSVYALSDEQSIKLYFKASTGTPEQFIGEIAASQGNNPVKQAAEGLKAFVESELGWSLADSETSQGQEIFAGLGSTAPHPVDRYPIQVLQEATTNATIDIGTPDTESAVGVLQWLVAEGPREWSVAIAGDGRTAFLSDVDIVIVPGATTDDIRGINGSDELIQDTFIEAKAGAVIEKIHQLQPNQDQSVRQLRTQVLSILTWFLNAYNVNSYIADRASRLQYERLQQAKYGGGIAAVIGALIGFVYGGGISNLSQWWNAAITNGDPIQFATTSFVNTRFDLGLPSLSPTVVLVVTLILVLLWAVGIGVAWIKTTSGSTESTSQSSNDWAESHHEEHFNRIMNSVHNSQLADSTEIVAAMSNRTAELPPGVVLRSEATEKRNRLLITGGVSLGSALIGGALGFGTGQYLQTLLSPWVVFTEVLVIVTVVAALVGVAVTMFQLLR